MARIAHSPRAEEHWSVPRAANELGIGRTTAYDLIKRGKLAVEMIDGLMFVSPAAVHDYQAEKRRQQRETTMTPAQRKAASRLGGLSRAMKYSPAEMQAQVQAGRDRAMDKAIDPDGRLRATNRAEYERRAELWRKRQLTAMQLGRKRQQRQYGNVAATTAQIMATAYYRR